MSTNFCSFVFTEAGRALLADDELSLAKYGWQLAELHEDRRDVSVRFHDQEDRETVHVHPSYEQRVQDAEKEHCELLARMATPEGRVALLEERRARMREVEAKDRERADAETRRMQKLLDDLYAWKPPLVLERLKESIFQDARNWTPAIGFRMPEWAETDDGMTAHLLESAGRRLRRAREELDEERQKVVQLNDWLARMRATFGPEPEGYWKR